jgi:hypothetical protein
MAGVVDWLALIGVMVSVYWMVQDSLRKRREL